MNNKHRILLLVWEYGLIFTHSLEDVEHVLTDIARSQISLHIPTPEVAGTI